MAGVPLPEGLPPAGDPPPGGGAGPDLLLLPHPVGGVLDHAAAAQHNLPRANRPADRLPQRKQVLKVGMQIMNIVSCRISGMFVFF